MEFFRLLGALLDSSVRDVFIVNCKGHTHDGVDTNAPDPWLIIANFFNSLSFKPDTYFRICFRTPPHVDTKPENPIMHHTRDRKKLEAKWSEMRKRLTTLLPDIARYAEDPI